MQNSDQIKEAPEPTTTNGPRQIFQNFTDATVALMNAPDTPTALRRALAEAIHEAGNMLWAHDMPDCPEEPTTRYTLTRIFNLTAPDADADAPDVKEASWNT